MKNLQRLTFAFSLVAVLLSATTFWMVWSGRGRGATPAGWLTGTHQDRFVRIANHLRGLDVAMAEVGYRFTELYFAGMDNNWEYAKYHLEKIETTLRLALERRPRRAASAEPFLSTELPHVAGVVARQDRAAFLPAMERLRSSCMKCHSLEKVPYFTVELPLQRLSTIRRTEP